VQQVESFFQARHVASPQLTLEAPAREADCRSRGNEQQGRHDDRDRQRTGDRAPELITRSTISFQFTPSSTEATNTIQTAVAGFPQQLEPAVDAHGRVPTTGAGP
jgi:hypothetical protein